MAGPSRTVDAALDLDGAVRAADAAARAAGVSVRELTDLADLDRTVELFATIWGRSANPPVTVELLRAFAKAGNYVAGAVDGAVEGGRLVGACVGFFHAPAEDALHSHIAGVAPAATNRSIGFALKLHQRAWAMARGVGEIAWTFDPLVARNAHFNLVKLAARPAEYLPDFYGPQADAINGDADSDRLLVRWRLRDPAVVLACAGGAAGRTPAVAGAVAALGVDDDDGGPLPGRLDGPTSLVAVPPDVGRLRLVDPGTAQRWRVAVREALTGLVARGGRIDGFDRAGGYVVRGHR
ncbi:GNAT family N-acetyltransferase [Pseudonocardia humida]|uniref:GNAT family N-acetyltransferase n=1 Tax=Pseudonocardia humida TaxID=2800819 RepID=A0ABT0ZY29_9PSEU|nr:GNAT family N-acetyltransferase [Pseudonocardia humida]MCO1655652.1 GNAT family N-acetyltransferase [Pseudonocardia humida]